MHFSTEMSGLNSEGGLKCGLKRKTFLYLFSDGTRVTEACTSTLNTCVDSFAVCNGTVCDCMSGYYWNGTHCSKCRVLSEIWVFQHLVILPSLWSSD